MNIQSTIVSGRWSRPAEQPVPSLTDGSKGEPDILRFRVTNEDGAVIITVGDYEIAFDPTRAKILGLTIATNAEQATLG